MRIIVRSLIIIFFAISGVAHAALITEGFISAGDGLATYDTNTESLWVKSSLTAGLTLYQVQDLISTNPLFSGFRIASRSDIINFLNTNNFSGFSFGSEGFDGTKLFYDSLVSPQPFDTSKSNQSIHVSAYGLTDWYAQGDTSLPQYSDYLVSYWGFYIGIVDDIPLGDFFDPGTNALGAGFVGGTPGAGFILVRAVPIPSSYVLFISAFMGLVTKARVRTRQRHSECCLKGQTCSIG